ncbi:MAG: sugar ABC transporter permease, partial [Devosia sp.]
MTVSPIDAAVPVGERRGTPSAWSKFWHRNAAGYGFLTPWLIGFFGLTIGPALISLYLSFTDFNLLQAPTWVGDANYLRIFTADPKFLQAMRVTFFYVLFSVPLKLAFALAIAMLLNRGLKGLPLYRAVFYLPSLLGASVAIAVLWRQLFQGDGLINRLLATIGIDGPSWISNPRYALWTLVLLSIWQFGSPMII